MARAAVQVRLVSPVRQMAHGDGCSPPMPDASPPSTGPSPSGSRAEATALLERLGLVETRGGASPFVRRWPATEPKSDCPRRSMSDVVAPSEVAAGAGRHHATSGSTTTRSSTSQTAAWSCVARTGRGSRTPWPCWCPFLLDGVMAASRMDSLGGGRSMRTLLLCLAEDERGDRFRHEQRTGYTWLEFNGMTTTSPSAAAPGPPPSGMPRPGSSSLTGARGSTSTWHPAGPAFEERPGGGRRCGTPSTTRPSLPYRGRPGAVRARPPPLPKPGGAALVLRRPHLAGKLNLEHLSKVLSDGLAALDDQLITDVAASFEDLEAVQRDLRRLQEAHRTVQSFLPVYRRYLRASARSGPWPPPRRRGALRAARRRVAAAAEASAAADRDAEWIQQALPDCATGRQVAEQRQRALLESPAYRDASSLVDVEGRAADAERATGEAESRLASAVKEHAGAVARARRR